MYHELNYRLQYIGALACGCVLFAVGLLRFAVGLLWFVAATGLHSLKKRK